MSPQRLPDDEVVYRRIPPGESYILPSGRISSGNFKLDADEQGLSVYLASLVSVAEVLRKPDALPNSTVASVTVGQIRGLQDASGNRFPLDVVVVDDEDDPGHAEIRGPEPGGLSTPASKALRDLFQPR